MIGVIGTGYWGKNLVRNFYELGVLSAICDFEPQTLDKLKSQYPGVKIYTASRDLLQDSKIKAVAIATPAATHYEEARLALLADKDVFVEKPLALKVEEGKELVSLAREKNKILMVGHLLHYHPAVEKLKELIEKGELGEIYYIYSNRLNWGKIRTEENILWSFAPHDISLILSLAKEIPEEVKAYGGTYLQKHVEDVTFTFLNFKSGLKAYIFVSWLNPYKEQRFVVIGKEKLALFDDQAEDKLLLFPHIIKWNQNGAPEAIKKEALRVEIEKAEPLKKECLHFLECLKTRQKPLTDGEEGLRVLTVLKMAEESLKSPKLTSSYNQGVTG
jgi:UDP-2-acetamido-3-amino-2,3-dideoxy-glucuronate N-acetyltransferase